MTAWARILLLVTMTTLAVACKESNQQKAQNRADTLVKESQQISQELTNMGIPQASWTEEELTAFDQKLLRLETIQSDIRDLNEKDGVKGSVEDNSAFIKTQRDFLKMAREERARKTSAIDNSVRFKELVAEDKLLEIEFTSLGEPTEDWAEEDLEKIIEIANNLITNQNTRIAIVKQNPTAFASSNALINTIETEKESVSEVRDNARKILNSKKTQTLGRPNPKSAAA